MTIEDAEANFTSEWTASDRFPVPKVSLKIRHMYMQSIWNIIPTEGFACNESGFENDPCFTAGLERG